MSRRSRRGEMATHVEKKQRLCDLGTLGAVLKPFGRLRLERPAAYQEPFGV